MEKNFDLLRPFDLEAAKRGEAICNEQGQETLFIAHIWKANDGQRVAILDRDGNVYLCNESSAIGGFGFPNYRMAPLAWVEGKPVYKGDVLYDKIGKKVVAADGKLPGWLMSTEGITFNSDKCTWQPPKVKREGWVNIYKALSARNIASISSIHASPEDADREAAPARIACVRIACVRIEWEE